MNDSVMSVHDVVRETGFSPKAVINAMANGQLAWKLRRGHTMTTRTAVQNWKENIL